MDNRIAGVILGVAGILLWFAPFQYVEFMDMVGYQSGQHIGGISYLLPITSLAYAAFAWNAMYELALVASATGLGIALLFAIQAGSSIGWGLIALPVLLGCSAYRSYRDKKRGGNTGG